MSPLDPWDPLTDQWKYIAATHITDWPEECLEVLALDSSLCAPKEVALIMNIPVERVFAWFDFARTYLFGPPPESIPAPEAQLACQDWVWTHRTCCAREMWERVGEKHYVLAELHGIDQPRDKIRKLIDSIASASDDERPLRDVPGPSQRRRPRHGRRP